MDAAQRPPRGHPGPQVGPYEPQRLRIRSPPSTPIQVAAHILGGMRNIRPHSPFFALCALLVGPAGAQTVLSHIAPPIGDHDFGCALVSIDDVDGDGIRDLAVSSCGRSVHIISSVDESVLRSFDATGYVSNYGLKLASPGDVDGDGFGDLAIGQLSTANAGGTVWVVNARTGVTIFEKHGQIGNLLSSELAAVGDVDGDGITDVAAYALGNLVPGIELEYVEVWSGATGALLQRFEAPSLNQWYGFGVNGVGDVNGDGHSDIAFGSWTFAGGTELRVQSGLDGALLLLLPEYAGFATGVGDVDGDGLDDFAAIAEGATPDTDSLRIVSGTGSTLARVDGFRSITGLRATTDLNGDGVRELLFRRAPWPNETVQVQIRDGADGSLLNAFDIPDGLGSAGFDAMDRAGDLDGDSVEDIAISVDPMGTGSVLLLRGGALLALETSCDGAPNSVGSGAQLSAQGSLSLTDADLRLTARDLPPETNGLFVRGMDAAHFPFGDGFLCISPFGGGLQRIEVVGADAQGVATTDLAVADLGPGMAIAAGTTWSFQLVYRDPNGGPHRFNLSSALRGPLVP